MDHFFPEYTHCLEHQLPEDQSSPVGLVCPLCKQRLYVNPPQGRVFSCWESQPGAYTRMGEPCFVYTIIWPDFRIRSLHPAGVLIDTRSVNAPIFADLGRDQGQENSPVGEVLSFEESTDGDFSPPPPEEDEFGLFGEKPEE